MRESVWKWVLLLCLGGAVVACQKRAEPGASKKVVLRATKVTARPKAMRWGKDVWPLSRRFAEKQQPFAFVLPQVKPVKGVGGVRAEHCGACHTEIYKEWSRSTHASALADIQYQAELAKLSSPRWLCLNCHIPVQNQRRRIVVGLHKGDVLRPATVPNPHFDQKMQREGITCAACHVRRDAQGKSYIVGAIGSRDAPHPVKQDRVGLRRVCLRCHNPQGRRLTRHLVCWFKTKAEHDKSPYAGKKDCVDCHMPAKQRRLVPAYKHLPKRKSHQHHWVGGGIPKWFEGYQSLQARGYKPGLKVEVALPKKLVANTTLSFVTYLVNARAGHWLPTADPERFLLAQASLQDKKGKRLQRKSFRIGQTWEWEPQAKKVGDNRLKPLEKRPWSVALPLPKSLRGVRLIVTVYHVRLSSHTARYMKKHSKATETWLPKAPHYIKNIGHHYPMASVVFREEIALDSGQRKKLGLAALIRLSKEERKKPLAQRDY